MYVCIDRTVCVCLYICLYLYRVVLILAIGRQYAVNVMLLMWCQVVHSAVKIIPLRKFPEFFKVGICVESNIKS